jgi:dTDP-glucose 4,6-dehydratase
LNKILLTGATGHAGAFLVEHLLNSTEYEIVSLERLRSHGAPDRLAHINLDLKRYSRYFHDFRAPLPITFLRNMAGKTKYIIHNGAEVHAIRSLMDPGSFVQSNVIGTANMLEAARVIKPEKFIYTSSAEVLGPAMPGASCDEEAALFPSNPYSATKAAGEMLCRAYHRSFGVPTIITRTMNMFGERQQVTKSVPMFLKKILNGETIGLHVGPNGEQGTRQWMYVRSYVDALHCILECGKIGEVYHIAGEEKSNLEIATIISNMAGFNLKTQLIDVSVHHKAHDLRYSMSGANLYRLNWIQPISFIEGMEQTVTWTMENLEWLE